MKILITGGRGFIGRHLRKELSSSDNEFFILTRGNKEDKEGIHYIKWYWKKPDDLSDLMNNIDIVVNLAGEHIADKSWTKEQKDLIYKSRIETTKLIVTYINNSQKKPKKLISASAVGIYGDRGKETITENSSIGSGFLAHVCKDWEEEAQKVETHHGTSQTNVIMIRIGLVLGKDGGVLPKMLPAFKWFLGGPLGSGRQYMSWVHIDDVVGLMRFAILNENISGALNATSPNPVTNKEFSRVIGKIIHRPSCMPIPGFGLRLLFGEMADEMLLSGQKVLPEKAVKVGYKFKYTDLEGALKRLL